MSLFLIAHMADQVVAISADQVESVVDLGSVVRVPNAPVAVRGLAALRSRVVTVISARAALGAPAGRGISRAVITVIDGHHYAILVAALEDVASFDLKPLPPGLVLSGGWRAAAAGIVELNGEPTLAINLRALIPTVPLAA